MSLTKSVYKVNIPNSTAIYNSIKEYYILKDKFTKYMHDPHSEKLQNIAEL